MAQNALELYKRIKTDPELNIFNSQYMPQQYGYMSDYQMPVSYNPEQEMVYQEPILNYFENR